MAAEDNRAEISIGAKIDEAVMAVKELQGQFADFSKQATTSLNNVSSAGDALVGTLKKIASSFLSFEAVKQSIETTKQLGIETLKLASIFGMTQAEASQFAVAIDDVHGNVEQVEHAAAFLSRQLRTNEEALNRAGLATRTANGSLKDQKTLFMDAVTAINSYKAGTDRNAASVVLFGRGALEMQEIMRLTPQVMEEARQKADELGLTMTEQGAKSVMNYRDAMQNVRDVVMALQKVIGDAFMPILTDLGNWFAGMGKDAVLGFKFAIDVLASAINGIVLVFQIVAEAAAYFIKQITTGAGTIASVFMALQRGDWAGVKAAWQAGGQSLQDNWDGMLANIEKHAEDTRTRLGELWNPDKTPAGGTGAGGTKSFATVNPNLLAQLEAQLAAIKTNYEYQSSLQGQFQKYSLDMEADYWNEVLKRTDLSRAERAKVLLKYYALETEIGRRNFAAQIEGLTSQEAAFRHNLDARLAIAQERARQIAAAMGAGSPEAMKAMKDVIAIQREIADQQRQIQETTLESAKNTELARIDALKVGLDQEVALRKISNLDAINAEKNFADARFAIQRDAIQKQIDIEASQADADKVKIAKLNADKEKLESDHLTEMLKLQKDYNIEAEKYSTELASKFEDDFASMFDLFANKSKSASQIFKDFANSVMADISRIASKQLAAQLFGAGTTGGDFLSKITGGISGLISGGGGGGEAAAYVTGMQDITKALASEVPRFDLGTPYVPRDMMAMIHQGEKIIPAGGSSVGDVHNYFTISGPVNKQTQEQVSLAVARGLQRAMARSG